MTDKPDDLTHLERIARAASPGPWETEEDKYLIGPNCEGVRYRESKIKHAGFSVENALHIATFNPQTVLDLIERVRSAEGKCELIVAGRDSLRAEIERRKVAELTYRFAAEKLLGGLMEMRKFLWDRDTRLMSQDGSCRDSHEGCEQALSHLWDIIDPLTDGNDKTRAAALHTEGGE